MIYHLVQKGDTVSSMAKKYKTTIEEIVYSNDLESADKISIGQILKIPMPVAIVEDGQTLSKIATQNSTTYQELARINDIKAPYTIHPNQILDLIQVYDEQIRFIDEKDKPIIWTHYFLILEHGIKVFGVTDDDGCTDRVYTNVPMKILSTEFVQGGLNV
jgi:LysM repeat protein